MKNIQYVLIIFKYIKDESLKGIYPNLEIIQRIMYTAVANGSGQRIILKMVKNYNMGSTMKEDSLNVIASFNIETEHLKTFNSVNIINDFI